MWDAGAPDPLQIAGRGRLPLGRGPRGLGCSGKARWVFSAGSLLLLPHALPHALSKNGQPLDAALYSRINCGDFLIAINK